MAIEDITTTKEESSSDFGARLLTNVRETNRAREKAFRKRQKKDERNDALWGVAGKIGIGLGDAYFKAQTDAFLNTEQITQNVLTTRNAFKIATATKEVDAAAKAYKGGSKAYWLEQGMLRARPQLKANYGNIYNKNQFENSLLAAGTAIGNDLQAAHEQRLKLTNSYLSSRGVHEGKDAYLAALKKTNPQNLSQGITKWLGKFVGLTPDEQISKYASNIYTRASELEKFQEAYKQTGDTIYADIIAKETPADFDFKNPEMIFGKIMERKQDGQGLFGDQQIITYVRSVTITDRESGEQHTFMVEVNEQGEAIGRHSSRQERAKRSLMVTSAIVTKDPVKLNVGHSLAQDLSAATKDIVNSQIDHDLKQFKYTERDKQNDFIEKTHKQVASYLAAAALSIQYDLQVTAKRAGQIALDIFSRDPNISLSSGAFKNGVGINNPYGTLRSMIETSALGITQFTEAHYRNLGGKDGVNFIKSFIDSSTDERKEINEDYNAILASEPPEGYPTYDRLKMDKQIADRLSRTVLDLEKHSLASYIVQAEQEIHAEKIVEAKPEVRQGPHERDKEELILAAHKIEQTLNQQEKNVIDYHRKNLGRGAKAEDGRPITAFMVAPEILEGPNKGKVVSVPGFVPGYNNNKPMSEDQAREYWKSEINKGYWPVYDKATVGQRSMEIHTIMEADVYQSSGTGSLLSRTKKKTEEKPESEKDVLAREAVEDKVDGAVTPGETLAPDSLLSRTEKRQSRTSPELFPDSDAVTGLISDALENTKTISSSSKISLKVVNAVFDIETNASDPVSVRTVEDSGHDAHGIGQIKTATAVQPGYKVENIFEIAERLGIDFDINLKNQAAIQAARAFKPITGKPGKEVIRLLRIPEINAAFSVSYLNAMHNRYNGDIEKVLLAYNQGPQVADNYNGDRSMLRKEGRQYLEKAEKLGVL